MASKSKELTPSELSYFFSNLELVYRSGLSLTEGFDILRNNAQNTYEKVRFDALYKASTEGTSLYAALKAQGDLPAHALSLIRIGEETGRMEEAFSSLRSYYEKRETLLVSLRASLTYPLSMLLVVIIIVIVLLTQAMPVFDQVFRQLGFEMTGIASSLLSFGLILRQYALVVAIVIAVIVVICLLLRLTSFGRRLFRSLYKKAPLTRTISFNMSVQHFALALSSLLSSGLTVDQALEYAEPLVDDPRARECVAAIHTEIEAGESFLTAIERSKLFSPGSMALLSIGFKTGTDSVVLERVGEQIGLETEHRLEGFVSVIEPTLVAIMCVLVGSILLSVMMPLLGALTGF